MQPFGRYRDLSTFATGLAPGALAVTETAAYRDGSVQRRTRILQQRGRITGNAGTRFSHTNAERPQLLKSVRALAQILTKGKWYRSRSEEVVLERTLGISRRCGVEAPLVFENRHNRKVRLSN
jgi:hypothetical protein